MADNPFGCPTSWLDPPSRLKSMPSRTDPTGDPVGQSVFDDSFFAGLVDVPPRPLFAGWFPTAEDYRCDGSGD